MKIHQFTAGMILLTACLSCGLMPAPQSFSPSAWKSASKDERRRMAGDFLKTYKAKGMSLEQVKDLLGDPDNENDVWSYNLSTNGAPPGGPQSLKVFLDYPQLYVHFKEGRVKGLSVTHGVILEDHLEYESQLWKSSKPAERLRMVAQLIDSKALDGLTKDGVTESLGAPDSKSEKREIEYDLGFRAIDMVTLTFALDDNGLVTKAEIIEH